MYEGLKIFIYYAIIFTPYRLLCYIPFYKRLRFSLPVSIGIFAAVNILHYAWIAFFTLRGIDPRLVEFSSIVSGIPYFILVKEKPSKLLFFYIFILDVIVVVRGVAVFLMYTFFGSGYITELIVYTACFMAFLPFIVALLKKAVSIIFDVDAPRLWHTIWLLPFVTSAIILIFTYDLSPVGSYRWQFITARLLFMVAVLMTYGVLLVSLKNIKEQMALKEKTETANKLSAMYMTQYDLLYSHIREVRRARHDLKQHINLIRSYAEKEDIGALKDYLDQYSRTLPGDIKTGYCSNKTIDVVLSWYGDMAQKSGIDFITDIRLPEEIDIPEPKLCVLFGNLLENAVDACKAARSDKPCIKICSTIVGNAFSLTVDNTCENPLIYQDGRLMSTKHKGTGYGTYSVRALAEEYNGVADFRQSGNMFYASVLLYLE